MPRWPVGALSVPYCGADAGFGAEAGLAAAGFEAGADLPAGLFVLSASSDFDSCTGLPSRFASAYCIMKSSALPNSIGLRSRSFWRCSGVFLSFCSSRMRS